MKRFAGKISLFLVPLIIWYGVFLAFEPNNYFHFSKEDRKAETTAFPIKNMRKIKWNSYECMLLGDSRVAGIKEDVIEDITNKKYYNLAFGGCSIKEEIDLFWWAVKQNKFERVVFVASFWTINKGYSSDRIGYAEQEASEPIRFLLTGQNHVDTIRTMIYLVKNDDEQHDYSPEERQKNKEYYADQIIYPAVKKYEINYSAINEIKKISDYCRTNGIAFSVFIPPVDKSIWEKVIKPLDLQPKLDEYKSELSKCCKVYDLEYENIDDYKESDFADGFHLNGSSNIDYDALKNNPIINVFLKDLFMIENKNARIWEKSVII